MNNEELIEKELTKEELDAIDSIRAEYQKMLDRLSLEELMEILEETEKESQRKRK